MAEYIEREALLQEFSLGDTDGKNSVAELLFELVRVCIKNQPAADVVEVRHEEWNDNIIGFCNVCMGCGVIVERTAIKNKSGELNFCPNCGAKMDGKGEGE